jgi:hypothetical protein
MGLYDFTDPTEDEDWNPRKMALSLGLFDNPDEGQSDPQRFSQALGLTNSELSHQGKLPQENYLDDNLGSVTRSLPIDQPNGSIVSGGREDLYHKYSQMLEQKPEGDSLLSNYLGRMPTHAGFQPSGHDRAIAAVMGGIAGLNGGGQRGIATSQQWLDKPFEEQTQDWKGGLPLVELQAKQADSTRNRQASGILSMIRQQEVDRENKRKDELTGMLRNSQQQNAENNRTKTSNINEYYNKRIQTEQRGQDLAHQDRQSRLNKVLKAAKEKDPLTEFRSLRGKEKGWTVLDSLGFGQGNGEGNPEPFINPITGKPYTPEEISRMGTIGEGVK